MEVEGIDDDENKEFGWMDEIFVVIVSVIKVERIGQNTAPEELW